MMQRLFNEISDPVRVAALNNAIASLSKHNFDWNNHYIATTEASHKLTCALLALLVINSWREQKPLF